MAASLKVSELSGLTSLSVSDLFLISDVDADASKKVSFADIQSNISLTNLGSRSIDDLSDVDTSTVAPTNGQVLAWNSAAGEWQPATDQKHTQASLGVDHLITLTGVAEGSDSHGIFTGSTIANSSTTKSALQQLETAVEARALSTTVSEIDSNADALIALSGVNENVTNLGAFSGSTISASETIKGALQDLETAHEAYVSSNNSTRHEIDANVDDIITLTGISENTTNLGTFTGDIITDNTNIKTALQDIETAIEANDQAAASESAVNEIDGNVNDLITLSGVGENSTDLGSFTGSTITTGGTTKEALQELETAHELDKARSDALVTLSGVSAESTNLGEFTGVTIADDLSLKAALQALESAHEESDANSNDLITLSGVSENATNLGTFSGTTISNNVAIKTALQQLETKAEAPATAINTQTCSTNANYYLTFVDSDNVSATGELLKTDAGIYYNPFTNQFVANGVNTGTLSINSVDITATATEINLLDGVTATTTEINYLDGVTSAIQTQLDTINSENDTLQGVTGTNLGTFSGSTIADSESVKGALQDLETAVELRSLDADVIKHDGSVAFSGNQSLGGYKLNSVGEPAAATDAATKNYVDVATAGIGAFWTPVDYAVGSNVTLSGEQTIDGETTSTSRVLVFGQTDASENGIYVTAAGAWSRATDADNSGEWLKNKTVYVSYGDALTDAVYAYVGSDSPTVGTDDLDFTLKNTALNIPDDSIVAAKIAAGAVLDAKIATMTATKLTGTIADARVASSSITQHEADITITESQISDLHHPTQADLTIDHLHTLSGVAASSDDLGTFTGATIADSETIKGALQDLETAHEEVDENVDDLVTLTGANENDTTLGAFSGSTLGGTETIKSALQTLETAVETKATDVKVDEIDDNVDDLTTAVGINEQATHLGTFTGSTISDNRTVKQALQELETQLETDNPVLMEVHNESASAMSKGDVVRITGQHDADGAPHVELADANGNATYPAIGLVAANLAVSTAENNIHGFVVLNGLLSGIDTDTPGWSTGDILYLSETAGEMTSTRPTDSGSVVQQVAIVVHVGVTDGCVYVTGAGGGGVEQTSNDVLEALGISAGASNMGAFSGTTITGNGSIKSALQELETAVETKATDVKVDEIDANADALIALSGVNENVSNLGVFNGTIIADSETIKGALQDLEDELGNITLTSLDIDGATSGTIADASLFVIDEGADGTNKKVTASAVANYVAAEKTIKDLASVGTTADSEPTNYYFLAVDASNGQIVILDKEFVETEGSN